MKVVAYDPYLAAAEMAARGADKVELDQLLRRSDYVSISCPLTKESRGMIGAREFALMQGRMRISSPPRGAYIHDEAALVEALRNKRIAGAGSTSGPRNRRRRIIRCCSSTMCWQARTRRA